MNPYFVLFSIYAVLITPITLHLSVRVGHGVSYRVRVQAAGLPFIRRVNQVDKPKDEVPVREEDVKRTIGTFNWQLLRAVLGHGRLRRIRKFVRLEQLYVHARLSFQNAAATALVFAAVRTTLQTLARCGVRPRAVRGRVEADFQMKGSELFVRGIISVRLGSLGLAAILLAPALIGARGGNTQTEEDSHAAASH